MLIKSAGPFILYKLDQLSLVGQALVIPVRFAVGRYLLKRKRLDRVPVVMGGSAALVDHGGLAKYSGGLRNFNVVEGFAIKKNWPSRALNDRIWP